ncbi:MAG: glycosyltransferase family 2 protein [Oscillospiraceae bacterium]|jgi:glycosyltransferase involved in cell wall biosynthesis|nr:glycosyltransferase family 2 protein [Oscillospiraceae bacterium]
MLLSVIIPCFNEEKVIELTYAELAKQMAQHSIDAELIFIDDGSRDKTPAILKSLGEKDSNVKYICFSRNFGKESAMLAGLKYAAGDCAVIMDADLQHPPEVIPLMLEKYKEGYDQVIAKRNRAGDAAHKSFFARSYYKLVNSLVDVKMEDGVGDFRLLSRKAINALTDLNEYNRFSKGLFSWIGFKTTKIEYENQSRAAGETKWSFKNLLQYGIDGIISFNNKPLRFCFVFGFIAIIVGLLYLIIMLVNIIINGIDAPGYFTTIFIIALFGGVQLISIGVIGEYIGRIYYEVKRRPHFLVEETNATPFE